MASYWDVYIIALSIYEIMFIGFHLYPLPTCTVPPWLGPRSNTRHSLRAAMSFRRCWNQATITWVSGSQLPVALGNVRVTTACTWTVHRWRFVHSQFQLIITWWKLRLAVIEAFYGLLQQVQIHHRYYQWWFSFFSSKYGSIMIYPSIGRIPPLEALGVRSAAALPAAFMGRSKWHDDIMTTSWRLYRLFEPTKLEK